MLHVQLGNKVAYLAIMNNIPHAILGLLRVSFKIIHLILVYMHILHTGLVSLGFGKFSCMIHM